MTEIAHYLRLLYAKVGELFCPDCDAPVRPSAPDELFAKIRESARGKRTLYAPAVRARKGTYLDLFTNAARAGVVSARVDGAIVAIDPPPRPMRAMNQLAFYAATRIERKTCLDGGGREKG